MTWKGDRERHALASKGIMTTYTSMSRPGFKAMGRMKKDDKEFADTILQAGIIKSAPGLMPGFMGFISAGKSKDGDKKISFTFGMDDKELAERSAKILNKKFKIKTEVKYMGVTDDGYQIWGVYVPEKKVEKVAKYVNGFVADVHTPPSLAMGVLK